MANPNFCNKNHTVGKDEIRLSSTPLTPFSVPRYFSRGSAHSIPHTYIKHLDLWPPRSSHTLNTPRVSICRMRSRSPLSNVLPDQFESLTRARPLVLLSEERAERAETRRQHSLSRILGECSRARKEHNGNKSSSGRERTKVSLFPRYLFLLPHSPLPFSYVVFDLGWIDETRDTGGGRRHHQQQRRNAVLTSEREREGGREKRDGEIKTGEEVDTTCYGKQGKERGNLRKPRRDPSSLRDVEVREGLSHIQRRTFRRRAR